MSNPLVIDLSHHNPTPDWAALKAGGTIGVIHKATQGTGFVDDQLFARARAAMDAGLKWATYHFLTTSDPETQMAFYLNTVNPVEGERVCIDHEPDQDGNAPTLAQLKAAVQYILDYRRDLQITVYSGHLIEEQLGSTCDAFLAENTSLWTAQYTSAAAPSWCEATWPTWSLWQYTEEANVQGVSAPVDGNKWNGSNEALIAWFGPKSEDVTPEPEPESVVSTVNAFGYSVDVVIDRNGVAFSVDGEEKWRTENA
jgi:lysozyme